MEYEFAINNAGEVALFYPPGLADFRSYSVEGSTLILRSSKSYTEINPPPLFIRLLKTAGCLLVVECTPKAILKELIIRMDE